MSTSIVTHLRPGVLKGRLSQLFPLATAVDALGNPLTPIDYVDAMGRAWRAFEFIESGQLLVTRGGHFEGELCGGGGGGGGRTGAGGGGAGGFRRWAKFVEQANYLITIGVAGLGRTSEAFGQGQDGGATSGIGEAAAGGGGGGGAATATSPDCAGRPGGSGGGAGRSTAFQLGGSGIINQGNAGGSNNGDWGGGGGGGAATNGGEPSNGVKGSPGQGVPAMFAGVLAFWCIGGEGGIRSTADDSGGQGGGNPITPTAFSGTDAIAPGSGGGGAGGSSNPTSIGSGGSGASGRYVIRFQRTPPSVITFPSGTIVDDQGRPVLDQFGNFILAGS